MKTIVKNSQDIRTADMIYSQKLQYSLYRYAQSV